MSDEEVIERICSIPRDFRRGNVSVVTLVKLSGLCEHHEISREAIAKWLSQHPSFIDDWLAWSDDQRISEGWAFQETRRFFLTRFVIGYHPKGEKFVFTDKAQACAEFILRQNYQRDC